jgi:hypothetical protein
MGSILGSFRAHKSYVFFGLYTGLTDAIDLSTDTSGDAAVQAVDWAMAVPLTTDTTNPTIGLSGTTVTVTKGTGLANGYWIAVCNR